MEVSTISILRERGRILACLTAISMCGSVVRSQEIVGIDFSEGYLFSIDPKTASASLRADTGLDQWIWHSMAKDSQGRVIAGYLDWIFTTGTELYEVEPQSGSLTYLVKTDLASLRSLAFGPGDVLYGLSDPLVPFSTGPDFLYTIDLATGAATQIGSTGVAGIQGLAYGHGVLWGWQGQGMGLITIDPLTATVTDVNPDLNPPFYDMIQTLFFSDSGVLYGGFGALFVIDTVTGVPAYIGYMHQVSALAGMEFVSGQPAPFTLGIHGESGGPMGAFAVVATLGGQVAFLAAQGGGGPTVIGGGNPCAGGLLDLNSSFFLIDVARADARGMADVGPRPVPPLAPGAIRLQALDLTTCRTSNVARVLY